MGKARGKMPPMDVKFVARTTALALLIVIAPMIPVGLWSATLDAPPEWDAAKAFGATVLVAIITLGTAIAFLRPKTSHFGRREAFLMVALAWTIAPIVAGLPFLFWARWLGHQPLPTHPFQSPLNCYFEAMSGLTTTGASILPDIESLPRGLLLWRSTTHWLGGLGIVLLFVAILPMVGVTGRKLHLVESTGLKSSGTHPRIRDTARGLWFTYAALTLGSIVALRLAGLPWFESLCETFGAIATGGFSVRNQSIAAYHSAWVDAIIVLVMILGAINFSLYLELARSRYRLVRRDPELRLLLILLTASSLVVVLAVFGTRIETMTARLLPAQIGPAIRYGVFNLVSMHTDTGFATADFDQWPFLALAAIVLGTFIGGSAGSTTGGIKVVRLIVAAKILLRELQLFIRPDMVKPIRLGHRVIDADEQMSVIITILCFVLALFTGTVLLMLIGPAPQAMDLRTAFSASLACLCTAGPGLGAVGPTHNYLFLPDPGKIVLCFLMLIGRLEIIPILALIHPRFWRQH